MVVCDKCGCAEIEIKKNMRDRPAAYCKKCGRYIKQLTTQDLMDYYTEQIRLLTPIEGTDERPPCPYCTEKYIMLRGNERTRVFQIPLVVNYCPICGRKLSEQDKAY